MQENFYIDYPADDPELLDISENNSIVEEQEFKRMLKELRQQYKPTEYELILREQNLLLQQELDDANKENSSLLEQILKLTKENITIKMNIEKFCKKQAISFIRLFRESSKNIEITNEMQNCVNNFIFKLTHSAFLSKGDK